MFIYPQGTLHSGVTTMQKSFTRATQSKKIIKFSSILLFTLTSLANGLLNDAFRLVNELSSPAAMCLLTHMLTINSNNHLQRFKVRSVLRFYPSGPMKTLKGPNGNRVTLHPPSFHPHPGYNGLGNVSYKFYTLYLNI